MLLISPSPLIDAARPASWLVPGVYDYGVQGGFHLRVCPTLERIQRAKHFRQRCHPKSLDRASRPGVPTRNRNPNSIFRPDPEVGATKDLAGRLATNGMRQVVRARERRDHFRGAMAMLVDQHRDLAVEWPHAQSFCLHRDGPVLLQEAEPDCHRDL